MLGSPGGFSGGNSGRGAGGSSLSTIACQRRTRGDNGKRSAAIVSRSSLAMVARSAPVRSTPSLEGSSRGYSPALSLIEFVRGRRIINGLGVEARDADAVPSRVVFGDTKHRGQRHSGQNDDAQH